MLTSSLSTDELIGYLRRAVAGRSGHPDEVLLHDARLDARPPTYQTLRPRLPAPLGAALQQRGVKQLYAHQVAAIQAARAGQHLVVQTPTASGKTLCFNLPTIERLLLRPSTTALYLYPTKALMADQLRNLRELLASVQAAAPLRAETLSGDVAREARERMQADPPHIVLANPDILHHALLPGHRRWARFLANLDVVVLDELHAYRGAFGSHVGLILRRLRRLAARLGAQPTFIAASATIGNPAELAEQLVGLPFTSIAGDSAGAHARRFLFWRPPLRGSAELNEHRSATQEAVGLFRELLKAGRTAILFGKSRTAVERMLLEAREDLDSALARRVSAYRAGYTPEDRQRIEQDLREGRLRGVVATTALELGIDIGTLDAAILAGYPGTVMSTWQQAGRVGRRGGDAAIVILVGGDDALDQYYLNHPGAFFGTPVEQAVVDPGNGSVLLGHLLCAAREAPLREDELALFPGGADELVARLVREQLLAPTTPWSCAGTEWPHHQVAIRGVSRNQYPILLEGRTTLATIEPPHLYREAHQGAIYLHNGQAYRVVAVDEAARQVVVRREPADGRTDPVVEVQVAPHGDPAQRQLLRLGQVSVDVAIGPILAREEIAAYRERLSGSRGPVVKTIEPPHVSNLETVGLWIDFPEGLEASAQALHAAEHALVNALPIGLLCDRRDVGSASDPAASAGGRVYLYDAYEGGIGIAEKAYLLVSQLVEGAAALLRDCRCADGCPSCVHLPRCPSGNDELDKAGGLALLEGRTLAPGIAPARSAAPTREQMRDSTLPSRLRKISHEAMRERLAALGVIRPGDTVELLGHGPATVLQIEGERARVQYPDSAAWTWVPLRRLRRPGP